MKLVRRYPPEARLLFRGAAWPGRNLARLAHDGTIDYNYSRADGKMLYVGFRCTWSTT